MTDIEFNKYHQEVIELLREEIEDKAIDKGYTVQQNFFFQVPRSSKLISLHLVELDRAKKPVNVYHICPYSYYLMNIHSLKATLSKIQRDTRANVILVFKDEYGSLRKLPLERLMDDYVDEGLNWGTIDSFAKFYEIINEKCIDKDDGSVYFFRGQPNNKYRAIPSIFRTTNIEKEARLYHEAIRRNPEEFTEDMSAFDNLVKMQHYELPTRLLDITSNPLVALYFACQDDKGADGEVLVYSKMQDEIKYFDSDSVSILANLAKRPNSFRFADDKYYLIYDIQKERPKFDGKYLKAEAVHEVFCVLPKLNNDRITNQKGAFFIFGMGRTKDKEARPLDDPRVITIKNEAKAKILKELELMGIDQAFLFPETDKRMKQIKHEFCESHASGISGKLKTTRI